MPKSSRNGIFGSGTITVIDEPVMRSYARTAKVVFYVTWAVVGLLTASVLIARWQHALGTTGGSVLALITGAAIAVIPAAIAAALVAMWPIIRAVWWWAPELAIAAGGFTGWVELAAITPSGNAGIITRLIALAGIVGLLAVIRPARRALTRAAWCLVGRHRVRVCFSEFIITNRRGSLPLILGAIPTPAGERLWIWLRPGLSIGDLEQRSDKIAAACWATSVTAALPSPGNSALVRIDIKRRDPLTGVIASPLATIARLVIPGRRPQGPAPVLLDLTDVTAEDVTPSPPARPAKGTGTAQRPQWPDAPARRDTIIASPAVADGDDVSDWL
jgi:hypothetical protein